MQSVNTSIECYKKMWNSPTPNDFKNFQEIGESQTIAKTAREAEKMFSQFALTGIFVAAFAFKFLVAPIWLPTFLFAGITAIACLSLSLIFEHFATKFEVWKNLSKEKIQEIIFNHLLSALKDANHLQFMETCNNIEKIVGYKVVTFPENDDAVCFAFESANFSPTLQQKLEFLWEANRRHVLLTSLDFNENQYFVLDYIDYINRRIEGDPTVLNQLPIDYFHLQFKRFTIVDGQNVWGVKLTHNKQKVNFVVKYFPTKRLEQTCTTIKKNISVELFLHPDCNREDWIAFANAHQITYHNVEHNFSLANQS